MTPEFDVIGRTDGLQLRLKRIGGRYTQELTVPGAMGPLVSGDGRDIFVIVGGLGHWLAFERVGVDTRPSGSFRLQAQLDRPEFRVESLFKLAPERGVVDVSTIFEAKRPLKLGGIENLYRFEPSLEKPLELAPPDYAWLPVLKYEPDRVAGQEAFRSACVIIQHRDELSAVIPNLNETPVFDGLPAVLDYQSPDIIRCGLAAHNPDGNLFYRRQPGGGRDLAAGETVSYRFSLMIRRGLPLRRGHSDVVRFLWERHGRMAVMENAPAMPIDRWIRAGYDAFRQNGLWRGICIEGRGVGDPARETLPRSIQRGGRNTGDLPNMGFLKRAISGIAFFKKGPVWFRLLRDGKTPPIYFKAGANGIRAAVGLALYGRRWGDSWLQEAAGKIVDLIVSSPHPAGSLPEMLVGGDPRPEWAPAWSGRADILFSLENMAETGFWMLEYERIFGHDGLLDRCSALAELLVSLQGESGGFAQNVRLESGGRIVVQGKETAGASASAGRFLAALCRRLDKPEFLTAAERSADWLLSEELPKRRWLDSEIPFPVDLPAGAGRDPITGLFPQGIMAIYWTSDLLRRMAEFSGDDRYRHLGRAVLDDLLLYQRIWDAPSLGADVRGGFGSHNMGAVQDDPRGALFAVHLLDWYDATGDAEYFERAVAALQSGLNPTGATDHSSSVVGHSKGRPVQDSGLSGGIDVNLGRSGRPGSHWFSDWDGTAGTAAGIVAGRYGDAYVDIPRKQAFGINGCTVSGAQFRENRVDLSIQCATSPDPGRPFGLTLKFRTSDEAGCIVVINGHELGQYPGHQLTEGILWNPENEPESTPENSAEKAEGVADPAAIVTSHEQPLQNSAGESRVMPFAGEATSPEEKSAIQAGSVGMEEERPQSETAIVSNERQSGPGPVLSGHDSVNRPDPDPALMPEADAAPKPPKRRNRPSRRKGINEPDEMRGSVNSGDVGDEKDAAPVAKAVCTARACIATAEGLLGNDED